MGMLPSMKLLASTRPPTAAEINYNFTALWNLINGHVDAANAPTLLSKLTGGDIQAALRIINNGLIIGSAGSGPDVAGKLLIDHANALLEIATAGGAGTPAIQFARTAGTPLWSIYYDGTGRLVILPSGASTALSINAPVVVEGAGQVKKTESYFIRSAVVAAAGSADIIVRVPNDIRHAGGEAKLRCYVTADGADAVSEIDFKYQYIASGGTSNVGAEALKSWADFDSVGANVVHVSNWYNLTVPAATDQYMIFRFINGNAAGVGYTDVTLEFQYKVERIGLDADAV